MHGHCAGIPVRKQPGSPTAEAFRLKTKEVEIFRRGDEIVLREKDGRKRWFERLICWLACGMISNSVAARRINRTNARGCNGAVICLDTNICIYIRQKRPDGVLRRFQKLRPGEAVLSVITHGELLDGAAKSEQRREDTGATA
jgi:hypothetical protein